MSPRKSRKAAIQATKSLTTPKKQPVRAKKKPEPKKTVKKKPQKPKNISKKKDQAESAQDTGPNTNTQTSTEKVRNNKSENKSEKKNKNNRRKVISQERLLTVINEIGGNVGECSEKHIRTETEEIPLIQAVREQQNESNEETEDSEQRTIYSCKFCNKDFSSAFVLFLHIRIHEKVGSIKEHTEEAKPVQSLGDEKYADEDDSDDEPEIKEEIIEEITIPDLDDEDELETENNPLKITNQPKTNEFIGMINKNFVENLKKNLSLAMNRQGN